MAKLLFSLFCVITAFFSLNRVDALESLVCRDWQPYTDVQCYRIFADEPPMNWTEAQARCQSKDMRLLSIDNHSEQKFVVDLLFNRSRLVADVWLDGAFLNGSFRNSETGSELSYSRWARVSPQNMSDYCAKLSGDLGARGKWQDVPCAEMNGLVCEETQRWDWRSIMTTLKETRKELAESKAEHSLKIAQLETNPLPLGFIYVQLPKESAPSDIWPSLTWTEVSSTYAGVFFRVEGGGAGKFGDVQPENAPKLTQVDWKECQYSPTSFCGSINSANSLSIPSNGTWSDHVLTASNYVNTIEGIESSKVHGWHNFHRFRNSEGEVRPRNMAVKVWKRTG